MNAPHHGIHGKLAEWKEQTTFRAFLLGSGVPDAEDVRMALQVLKTHMERLGEDVPEHAQEAWEIAEESIRLAELAVESAIEEAAADPVSDADDFRALDNKARARNIA